MTATTPIPARLFVLLARTAPVGVILRRGPSKWVQLMKWHTDSDTFEPGQWFKGRLYETRCDLSPDGKLFLYFVLKGGHGRSNPSYTDSWTAISKPPYFTALALWPIGSTYGGGGRFKDNKSVWLSISPGSKAHPDHPPAGIRVLQDAFDRGDGASGLSHSQYNRVGWIQTQAGQNILKQKFNATFFEDAKSLRQERWLSKFQPPYTWQKQVGFYTLTMQRLGYRMGQGFVEIYTLTDNKAHREFQLDAAQWADFDQQRRLVLAKAGKLFSAAVIDGELPLTELADFNANQPEAIESPAWAKRW
ncbi:MAG: hypothetical protein ABI690_03980 [Chloroflexota bacterium]